MTTSHLCIEQTKEWQKTKESKWKVQQIGQISNKLNGIEMVFSLFFLPFFIEVFGLIKLFHQWSEKNRIFVVTPNKFLLSIAKAFMAASHKQRLLFTFDLQWKTCNHFSFDRNGDDAANNGCWYTVKWTYTVDLVALNVIQALHVHAKGLDEHGAFYNIYEDFFIQCTTCVRDESMVV